MNKTGATHAFVEAYKSLAENTQNWQTNRKPDGKPVLCQGNFS
jgi:hypothetical protein